MMKMSRYVVLTLLFVGLLATVSTTVAQSLPGQGKTIRMARGTWDTGWFQAEVFKLMFERLGYSVEGPDTYTNEGFYEALANGEVDLWVNGWFPHHNYLYLPKEEQIVRLGYQVRDGALQGYMVDRVTAEQYNIKTIADLADSEIAALFDIDQNGKADLIGCNAGWACEYIINHHLEAYGLTETVEHIQGDYTPLMIEVATRFEQNLPVIYYTWTPNWTVGVFKVEEDTVWLEVPFPSIPERDLRAEQVSVENLPGCASAPCMLGFPPADIRTVVNRNFLAENPAIAQLLEEAIIPLEDINAQNNLMIEGQSNSSDIERHAREWIRQNENEVKRWLNAAANAHARTQEETPETARPQPDLEPQAEADLNATLRVVTRPFPPFVLYQDRHYVGFSIDLWQEIADRLGVSYELVGVNSNAKLLDEAKLGTADAAIAGLSITAERENKVDFSHPFFEAGLQIMVPADSNQTSLWSIAVSLLTGDLPYVMGTMLIMLLFSAHLIWFFERRHNPEFPQSYVEGVWEGLWWSAVTATTVGYGDKTPTGFLGRLFGLFWMFAGLFLIAYFTAGITSTLTIDSLEGIIREPPDLIGRRVGTIADSVASDFLQRQGIGVIEYAKQPDMYQALADGELDAVVFDAPVLQHYVTHEGTGIAKVVGLVFDPHSYGIALPRTALIVSRLTAPCWKPTKTAPTSSWSIAGLEIKVNNPPYSMFDKIYAQADGDASQVPWEDQAAHPRFVAWLNQHRVTGQGQTALVPACGLGDEAELLADLGFSVTAFDVSPNAVAWCKRRFPASVVDYQIADLFASPAEWAGSFDLVVEVYTVQALPPSYHRKTMQALIDFLRPGGRLVCVVIGRDPDEARFSGPPWPLARPLLDGYRRLGLTQLSFEDYLGRRGARRFTVAYRR